MLGVRHPVRRAGASSSAEEIATYCSTNYGVTFPLTEKVEVNGAGPSPALPAAGRRSRPGRRPHRRHPLELREVRDRPGVARSWPVQPDDRPHLRRGAEAIERLPPSDAEPRSHGCAGDIACHPRPSGDLGDAGWRRPGGGAARRSDRGRARNRPRPPVSERRSMAYRWISDVGTGPRSPSPSPAVSVPCTRPRRALRSPITSPCRSTGTVTSSSLIGSSTTGSAWARAARKASGRRS